MVAVRLAATVRCCCLWKTGKIVLFFTSRAFQLRFKHISPFFVRFNCISLWNDRNYSLPQISLFVICIRWCNHRNYSQKCYGFVISFPFTFDTTGQLIFRCEISLRSAEICWRDWIACAPIVSINQSHSIWCDTNARYRTTLWLITIECKQQHCRYRVWPAAASTLCFTTTVLHDTRFCTNIFKLYFSFPLR